jgi:hypothetical protein
MAVSTFTITSSRLWPELLPFAEYHTIAAGSTLTPSPLDVTRFGPGRMIQVRDIALGSDPAQDFDDVQVSISTDNFSQTREVDAFIDPTTSFQERVILPYKLNAVSSATLDLFNLDTINPATNYPIMFSVLIRKPDIANKLFMGISLTPEEEKIAEEQDIQKYLDSGLLPLTFEERVRNQYNQGERYSVSVDVNFPVTAQEFLVEVAGSDEFLVLESLGGEIGLAGDLARILIDRDDQREYAEVYTFPKGIQDRDYPMFIPALNEIRLRAIAPGGPTILSVRATFRKLNLTDIQRIRWGLVSRDEVDPDIWDKTMGGIY